MKEKVFFENKNGIRLCGLVSDPSNHTDNPLIVMCHGFSTNKEGRTNTRLEEIFNAHNMATLRFDFFGHGESEGLFEDVTISEAAEDVQAALAFIGRQGYKKIGLFGSSFGGLASLLAASQTSSFFTLALKSPVSDYPGLLIARGQEPDVSSWKKSGYISIRGADGSPLRLNYSFYEDAEKIRGYEAAKKINIPTLIVHGDKDETVPLEQSKISAGLMGDCRLEIIRGADHIYSRPDHFEKMIDLVSRFIILQAGKKAVSGP